MNSQEPNGWNEWSRHVLKELERSDAGIQRLVAISNEIKVDIAMLKVKSSIWGAVAGLIVVLTSILIQFLLKR